MSRSVRCVTELAVFAGLLRLIVLGSAADGILVEDWSASPVVAHGLPAGWQRHSWGSPAYDFAIVDNDGRRALHLKSHDENSTITMDIKRKVSLQDTPILEWSWKAVTLRAGGDVRHGETDDEVLHVDVDWPRAPAIVR
jgi:hypothetical protein